MARKDADSSGFSTRVVAAPPVFPSAQPELDASLLTDLARCFWAKSGSSELSVGDRVLVGGCG